MDIKEIDWQGWLFVGVTLFQEYILYKIRVPRIEYWQVAQDK